MLSYLDQLTDPGVKGAIRIPMTASYWLGIETNASKANFEKYPNLGGQYQTMISNMVDAFTSKGHVVILDLHWSDDDTEQQPMPSATTSANFW
jgi:hypothetical protein